MSSLAAKEREISKVDELASVAWSGEAVAFCPHCKALQTVWIDGNTLMPTRRYFQEGSRIYHDCGSIHPCRLYHSW